MGRKRLLSKERVIGAIQHWFAEHGESPSIENLRKELKVGSTRTIFRYLQWLEEDGLIERDPETRSLRLLKPQKGGAQTMAVPVVGQVPAGSLMLADENIEGWIRIPKSFSKAGRPFLLRVRGNSMNRAKVGTERIENGDLVLVNQQSAASSNDVVVALIDGEATVKRFKRGPGYYLLMPESTESTHKAILLDDGFRVLGVVVRVLKRGSALTSVLEQMD